MERGREHKSKMLALLYKLNYIYAYAEISTHTFVKYLHFFNCSGYKAGNLSSLKFSSFCDFVWHELNFSLTCYNLKL